MTQILQMLTVKKRSVTIRPIRGPKKTNNEKTINHSIYFSPHILSNKTTGRDKKPRA